MKNLIYLDNSKEILATKIKYEKQITKISNDIKTNKLNSKFIELYHILKNIYNNTSITNGNTNLDKEYNLIITANYQKILTVIIIEICNNYLNSTKQKPHIILSYNESNFIINLCKKLVKLNIIESITILKDIDIINEFKVHKKSNTLFAFISNLNNSLFYNLNKLSSFCKYYNIILISTLEDIIYNYVYTKETTDKSLQIPFLNNQDIIAINYYNQKNKIYILLVKKLFLNKYKINTDNLLTNFICNDSIIYLINILSYYNTYELLYNKIFCIFNEFISLLNQRYKIINYIDFQKTKDIYFTNSITIILITNIQYTNILTNNLLLSIYMPDITFSNNQLLDYIKSNGIILHNNKLTNILPKHISNGLIEINFSYMTKSIEITKFIKILYNLIDSKIHNSSSIKKKKQLQFSTPEYIILSKPFKLQNKLPLKSILKK